MNFNNPLTNGKYYKTSKLDKVVFKTLYFIADNFFLEQTKNNLDILREEVHPSKEKKVEVPLGPNELNLNKIIFSDIVPLEDYDKLRRGLHKIYNQHPIRFQSHDPSRINEFFSDNNVGRLYYNILYLDEFKGRYTDLIKSIRIHLSSTASFVLLFFEVTLNDSYNCKLKKTIEESDYASIIKPLYLRNYLNIKRWKRIEHGREYHGKHLLEDYIAELKWILSGYFYEFIPLYIYQNKKIAPSVEIYDCSSNYRSLNVNLTEIFGYKSRTSYTDLYSNGYGEVSYTNLLTLNSDQSVKVFITVKGDSNYPVELIYNDIYTDMMLTVLPSLVLKTIHQHYQQIIVNLKKQYIKYQSSKSSKNFKLKKISSIKFNLDKNLLLYNKIKAAYLLGRYSEIYESKLGMNEKSYLSKINTKVSNEFRDLNDDISLIKSSIDDNLMFLDTLINFNRQRNMLYITLGALIVSVISLIISSYR